MHENLETRHQQINEERAEYPAFDQKAAEKAQRERREEHDQEVLGNNALMIYASEIKAEDSLGGRSETVNEITGKGKGVQETELARHKEVEKEAMPRTESTMEQIVGTIGDAVDLSEYADRGKVHFSLDNGAPIKPNEPARLAHEKWVETEELTQKARQEWLARGKRIRDYLEQHPDAVTDEEKAYYMATVGDKDETEAAKKEREAVKYLDESKYDWSTDMVVDPEGRIITPAQAKQEFNQMISEAEDIREKAWKKEELIGMAYDEVRQPSVTSNDEKTQPNGARGRLRRALNKLFGKIA